MTSSKVQGHPFPRLGTFLVGLFAGLCAAFFPRLAAVIGAPASGSQAVDIDAFRAPYIIASALFALLIGFGVVIWEWNTRSRPRQIFLAALGLPALFAGALNSVAISSNASRLGDDLKKITDRYREANDIPVQSSPIVPVTSGPAWDHGLVPAVFAQSSEPKQLTAIQKDRGGVDLGIYSQKKFWVVVYTGKNKEDANGKLKELGTRYGPLRMQQLDSQYVVTIAGALPYSEAVSRAVDIKRSSGDSLSPVLVPSR